MASSDTATWNYYCAASCLAWPGESVTYACATNKCCYYYWDKETSCAVSTYCCGDNTDNDNNTKKDCADSDCEGQACAEGKVCKGGSCVSVCAGCLIGETCYASGSYYPSNKCIVCSDSEWKNVPDGTDPGGQCEAGYKCKVGSYKPVCGIAAGELCDTFDVAACTSNTSISSSYYECSDSTCKYNYYHTGNSNNLGCSNPEPYCFCYKTENCSPNCSSRCSASGCALSAPTLILPENDAHVFAPPILSWNAVPGANCYKVGVNWFVVPPLFFWNVVNYPTTSDTSYDSSDYISSLGQPIWASYRWGVRPSSDKCNTFGPSSELRTFTIDACPKTTTPITDTTTVTLSSGIQCVVTITHLGYDMSDSSDVSYETISSSANSRKIGMDDNPNAGCENNLEFTNQWSPNTGTITITSTFEHIDATHDFSYGYDLLVSNNCVFKSFTKEEYDLGSFNSYCLNPSLSWGSVKCSQMWKQTASENYVRSTRYKYTLVECLNDGHCTDPALPKCVSNRCQSACTNDICTSAVNLGADGILGGHGDSETSITCYMGATGKSEVWYKVRTDAPGQLTVSVSPGASFDIELNKGSSCAALGNIDRNKDSIITNASAGDQYWIKVTRTSGAGTATVKAELKDTTPPTTNISVKRKSTGETVTGDWLKADTYTIQFTDDDNIGLKTCKYHVYKKDDSGNWTIPIANFDKPRTCSSFSFDIPAGTPPYEKNGRVIWIKGTVIDNADNPAYDDKFLDFDFLSPTTNIR